MLLPNLHQPIRILRGLGGLKETIQALLNSPTPSSLDSSVYSSVLQLCIDMNARREGRLLHDHLSSIGYRSDLRLDNKLLIFYGKVGDVDDARQVFDRMFRRTVVSWTAMISAYSQNGLPEEAVEAFVLMRRSGCYPTQFTFGSVLKACTGIGCVRIGSQVYGCALKSGFMDDRFVQAALVDLNAKCGSIEDARFIFDNMEERDLVSWNAMIGGCAVHGCGHESFELFHHMRRKGVSFDHFTFSSLLKACSRIRASGIVNQIHTLVIQLGLTNDSVVTGSLIDAYAKCRNMSSAKVTYESMKDKDLVSFTALVTGYSQEKGCSLDALELFHKKNHMGFQMDHIILCSMLNVCADTASVSLGRQMHAFVVKNQPKSDLAMANALVDMYAKTGEIEDARLVFDEMQFKNVISWTSMINGYGKHGNGEDAIMLFEKMEHQGLKPNDITFLSLLFACSHTGLTNKGWKFFNTMVCKYNIHPRAEHYSCIVDLLARGGQLEEAYDFLCSMDIKFNTSLWRTLLGACNMHTNLFLGKIAANCLIGMDPHSSANYVVLVNLYAATGHWEDAWKMRKLMEEKCIKKDAAWSSLQFTKRKPLLLESRLIVPKESLRIAANSLRLRTRTNAIEGVSDALWFPGSSPPKWLDGSLPGDFGFDPLGLGWDPELLRWFAQAELIHGRWAMFAVAGILIPECLEKLGFLESFSGCDAGAQQCFTDSLTLFVVQMILMAWVEGRRWADILKPGSVDIDPLMWGRGSPNPVMVMPTKEIKNGRLAMLAFVGFLFQAIYAGQSPLENLSAHMADPGHCNTFLVVSLASTSIATRKKMKEESGHLTHNDTPKSEPCGRRTLHWTLLEKTCRYCLSHCI